MSCVKPACLALSALALAGCGAVAVKPANGYRGQIDDQQIERSRWTRVGHELHVVAGRGERADDIRAEQQVGDERNYPRQGTYWARSFLNSWRTDSVRPHQGSTSNRPVRTWRTGRFARPRPG